MRTDPPIELEKLSLTEIVSLVEQQKLPPVEQWNPSHCGHSDMRIASDGTWYYQGSPIGRPAMVRLFSTILRREPDGRHVLVTPAEKLDIDVEDAPFLAIELRTEAEGCDRRLAFRLNSGDLIVADAAHRLTFEDRGHGCHPYLHVRGGLEALVARPVYYELANLAIEEDHAPLGLWSEGAFFPMDAAA
ncbi:DUF1285 domain-containing protein [Rhizorhapis suberifaciens]|uniref:DUF1285 domain-containing protein n=1 Tax=Rhizorhapis suberifaciens TaxID=13656 RepID=A0A840HRN9_9SPHN|nr:DUF1285 domain-containing protein [Rhizorhapis suberifaciens]MBB4640287.1 hypothetical protein [Rhizorhapis suberifaciens]